MRKTLWAVSLLALFPALLPAQNIDNTQYVREYLRQHPTWSIGTATTAAQLACNPDTSIPCIIVFDPSLAKYTAGAMPSPCSQCTWLDYRTGSPFVPSGGGSVNGLLQLKPMNPAIGSPFAGYSAGLYLAPTWNGTTAQIFSNTTFDQLNITGYNSRPGVDRGAVPVNSGVNWTVHKMLDVTFTNFGQGLSNSSISEQHTGSGDTIPLYVYANSGGNATAPDDEGTKAIAGATAEYAGAYAGTVTSGGVGATTITANCTANCGLQGDQTTLLDLSPVLSGCYVTSHTAPSGNTPAILGVAGCTLPVSTAIGTLASNVATLVGNPTGVGSTPETFNVNVSSGTFANGLVCFAGQMHEQALVTSAGTPSGGVQQVTVSMMNPHQSGSMIFQGGTCGDYAVFTALIGDGLKYPVDALGASDSSHLYVAAFGSVSGWIDYTNALKLGTIGLGFCQNNSTTTIQFTVSGSIPNNPWFEGAPQIYISGATDTALNGLCTSFSYNSATNIGTCTHAGLAGNWGPENCNMAYGDTISGNGDFVLYAGAQILDVQDANGAVNTTLGQSNRFTLEPNNAAWANGDTAEDEHSPNAIWRAATLGVTTHNPWASDTSGLVIGIGGAGSNTAGNPSGAIRIINSAPNSNYAGGGGWRIPVPAIRIEGPIGDGIVAPTEPIVLGGRAIYFGWTPNTDPGYWFRAITFGCAADSFNTGSGCGLDLNPGTNTFYDNNNSAIWEFRNLKAWNSGANTYRTVQTWNGGTRTSGHLAGFDANGDLQDAGVLHGTITAQLPALTSISTTALYSPALLTVSGTGSNITALASSFTCSVNPTIQLSDCGTSAACASPTNLGSVAVTAGGSIFSAATAATLTAGHFIAWQVSAGTCTSLQVGVSVSY